MILSGETIHAERIITPHHPRTRRNGMSFGESFAGYDVRARGAVTIYPDGFALNCTVERFVMPRDVLAVVHDKSTWARRGLSVFNTVIEPGWRGWLTLELVNHCPDPITIMEGDPIAQVVFHRIDRATAGYEGKYQDQDDRPVPAILEATL